MAGGYNCCVTTKKRTNTNSKRQRKPLIKNREGKRYGKALAALGKLFGCAAAQHCPSERADGLMSMDSSGQLQQPFLFDGPGC